MNIEPLHDDFGHKFMLRDAHKICTEQLRGAAYYGTYDYFLNRSTEMHDLTFVINGGVGEDIENE